VTFTNKAAQEMRERVEALIGSECEGIWLSTFHALCARLLRREAPKIGLSRDFVIYDSSDQVAVVRQAQRDVMEADRGRSIRWKIDELPTVAGDPAMLQLVFTNLLSNAVKYSRTRENATIEIGSRNGPGDESVVYVKDNGVGFDMAYANRLFGVFQRLHRAEEFEGTGIGLANVQRIVSRHGGRVWAESEPGKGATFYVALPNDRPSSVVDRPVDRRSS